VRDKPAAGRVIPLPQRIRVRWRIFLFLFGFGFIAYVQQRSLTVASYRMMPGPGLQPDADRLVGDRAAGGLHVSCSFGEE